MSTITTNASGTGGPDDSVPAGGRAGHRGAAARPAPGVGSAAARPGSAAPEPGSAAPAGALPAAAVGRHGAVLNPLIARVFAEDREYRHFGQPHHVTPDGLRNFLFAADGDPVAADPARAFATLRWGGQFVYASAHRRAVQRVAERFGGDGFELVAEPGSLRRPVWWLPLIGRRLHYVVARKMHLVPPGTFTDRFTYQVELERHRHPRDEEIVVCKRVPTVESVVARLRNKWPDSPPELIEKRARKFAEKIFPTFLTREAAILKILQEHLPPRYASRVPRVIALEKDIRGFVTTLRMNWLRNGGRPLSQLEFALQAADLLRAVHDSAGIIHLDLRLDNMVITEHGVGFVDFGSAVRAGENLGANPMLNTLFDELMRTSHIQKMLFSMTQSGQVTAQHLCSQHGRVDKAIDVFYLALQFSSPHGNPDLAGLIRYDPRGETARRLKALSATILRPSDPHDTSHKSAKDILRSLELIERDLGRGV